MLSQPDHANMDLRVASLSDLTPTIRRIHFVAANGEDLPLPEPGAHLKFQLPVGASSQERSYSLVLRPDQVRGYEIAVHRDPNSAGGSLYMHSLSVGDTIRARGPKNDFRLAADASHSVLIAGGIGITPILSMAVELAGRSAPFSLHYASRHPESMAYRHEVESFGSQRSTLYFDEGQPGKGIQLAALLAVPRPATHIYVCGPRPLIDATIAIGRDKGWPPEQIHFELFTNGVVADEPPLEVELRRSKIMLQVRSDQSILDAMIEAGCDPMFDCRRGECGSCSIRVVEGEPDHRDYCLSNDDKAEPLMCVCVSRAHSKLLVLDA